MPTRGRNNIPLKISEKWYENIYTIRSSGTCQTEKASSLSKRAIHLRETQPASRPTCNKVRERCNRDYIWYTYTSHKINQVSTLSHCITYATKHIDLDRYMFRALIDHTFGRMKSDVLGENAPFRLATRIIHSRVCTQRVCMELRGKRSGLLSPICFFFPLSFLL